MRATNAEGTSNWSNSGTGSTGANGLPIFTDGSSATRSFAENTTGIQSIGDPVTATDPENTTLTYSLEGTDKDAFTIDTSSGQLRTTRDETYNYEGQSRYVLSVKATDGHSGERTISVNIDLTDVNEAPTFTSDATFEAAENNSFAGQVTAEDVDSGDGITGYEVTGGADRNQFEITNTNQLHFKDDPDFEDPADNGRNNEYIVEVTATGGTEGRALTAAQTITVTVTNENDPPRFTSDNSLPVKENNRFVGPVVAEDVDSEDQITGYTITSGSDQNEFEITNTNQLHFKEDPDFERPVDVSIIVGNNRYIVAVTATGGTGTRERRRTQRIIVIVENVVEPPGKPGPPVVSDETENSLTVTWTAPDNTGPDIANYHVQYRISGAFTDWPDTGPSLTRTLIGLRSGTTYQIQVQAENAEGKGAWSNSVNGTTLTAPTVSSVEFTSTPASGQNNTYKLNDVIDVTVTFNEAVTVTGTPQIDLPIGTTVRQTDYQSGSTTTRLLFQYAVQADDDDTDGATINANGLKLNGGRIRRTNSTINADLVHGAQTNQSGHKVDGVAPALTEAEVEGDELVLLHDEVLDSSSHPATGDFAVTVDSEARSVSAVAVSSSEVKLTLASAVTSGQAVKLTYTPGTNPIRDQALNPAIALANLVVANQTQDPTVANICNRTAQVRDAIVAAAPVSTCGAVTADHLSAIAVLPLEDKSISTLKANDFSGLTALTTLDLFNNRLSTLPENLFDELTALTRLDLGNNQLSTVDENLFSELTILESLDLSGNQLGTVDENLFSGLTALTRLGLENNRLSTLPENLFDGLTALRGLRLATNQLSTLPENLFDELTALRVLDLAANQLSTLPENIFSGLTTLESLDLYKNKFSTLPENLFDGLTELTRLDLPANQLSTLPENIFSGLTTLESLDLYKNKFSTLPENLFDGLTALRGLDLATNQLSSLPDGIFDGLTALRVLDLAANQLNTVDGNLFAGLGLRTLLLATNQISTVDGNLFDGLTQLRFMARPVCQPTQHTSGKPLCQAVKTEISRPACQPTRHVTGKSL